MIRIISFLCAKFHIILHQLNSRHEYPPEIDLEEFLDDAADRMKSWVYKLHGVIVHNGTMDGGKYFTLFKPSRNGRWLKFHDEEVTYAENYEVFEDNFGHGEDWRTITKSALVLVYIREPMIDHVLAPVTEVDVPSYISSYLMLF